MIMVTANTFILILMEVTLVLVMKTHASGPETLGIPLVQVGTKETIPSLYRQHPFN